MSWLGISHTLALVAMIGIAGAVIFLFGFVLPMGGTDRSEVE